MKDVPENCQKKCKLYTKCKTPFFPICGQGKKGIVVIIDYVTQKEDRMGSYEKTNTGRVLKNVFKKHGIDLFQDCFVLPSVMCSAGKKPSAGQVSKCREFLHKRIQVLNPNKIFTFGGTALSALVGHKINVTGLNKWVGWIIPDQEFKCPVITNYDISYLFKNEDDEILIRRFSEYVKRGAQLPGNYYQDYTPKKCKDYFIDYAENMVINYLEQLNKKPGYIVFDYETTGLSPHKIAPEDPEHEIVYVSVSQKLQSVCFALTEKIKPYFKKVLQNKKIKKIAHNLSYEDNWTKQILGAAVDGWAHDTMISSHVLDNRSGITSLKFQAYVNFGVAGYDAEIKKYFEKRDQYKHNIIKRLEPEKAKTYCAWDSFFTELLYLKHKKELQKDKKLLAFHRFYTRGLLALSNVSQNGFCINTRYLNQQIKELEKEIQEAEEKIYKSDTAKAFQKKEGKKINPKSAVQMRKALFVYEANRSIKETATGNQSTDSEVLEALGTVFTNAILKHRKLSKLKSTYFENLKDNTYIDKCYPAFLLNTVSTFRSSGANPNIQNQPKRDPEAKKRVRECFIPSPGNKLVEIDYGQLEVRGAACYHKDPAMIKYLKDENSDMHRDTAIDLFIMKPEEVRKKQERDHAKNKFVFPEFYGSWYKECAVNIWNALDEVTKKHLRKKKISTLEQFTEQVKKVEHKFWKVRFKEYDNWKEKEFGLYLQNGYVRGLTGFKCFGPMQRNDVLNYGTQGISFHILLWSLVEVQKLLEAEKYNTKIIGEIHDSMILDMEPDEEKELLSKIKTIMEDKVREAWPWIIVPLVVEFEVGKVNGSWNTLEEVHVKKY